MQNIPILRCIDPTTTRPQPEESVLQSLENKKFSQASVQPCDRLITPHDWIGVSVIEPPLGAITLINCFLWDSVSHMVVGEFGPILLHSVTSFNWSLCSFVHEQLSPQHFNQLEVSGSLCNTLGFKQAVHHTLGILRSSGLTHTNPNTDNQDKWSHKAFLNWLKDFPI